MPAVTHLLLTLCFVAGKSGGHLLPCITQAEQIIAQNKNSKAYLFSSGTELDKTIMQKHPKIEHFIPTSIGSLPYKQPWKMPYFCYELGSYFLRTWQKLREIKPDKIISFGGMISIPVCLAGKLLGIPFELYELNVKPGKTVSFLSYFTNSVNICFTQTAQYLKHTQCVLTDYPVRFTPKDLTHNKKDLLKKFNFDSNRKTVLILGGSQGSVFVNQMIKHYFETNESACKNLQIFHQTGVEDHDNYETFYKKNKIPSLVFTYNEQLQDLYNLSDLVICRAGAGTLFEVKFFKKPCIIVPLQAEANNHQVENAYAMAKMLPEQFSVILQKETPNILPIIINSKLNI